MIDYIDESLRDLARQLQTKYSGLPTKSTNYTIMMQDLSKAPAGPVIPKVEFSSNHMKKLYSALITAPREFQEFFFVYYMKRWKRARKIRELGLKRKHDYYTRRDCLHAYLLGRGV